MINAAWRSLWELRRRQVAPLWARLLVIAAGGTVLALALMAFVAAFATVEPANWWVISLLPTILICICILFMLHATMRLAEAVLPEALLARLAAVPDVATGLCRSAIVLLGLVLGIGVSFSVVPPLLGFSVWSMFMSVPVAVAKFGVFLVLVLIANGAWWRGRVRAQALRHAADEAQLRLLQAQIEPHFLFNTLANVQSLMDADAPLARRMLEAFSDYLRAGLAQMRAADSTLGAELAMAQSYLELMQIRMQDRLAFTIDADESARAARVPALLLQPLVENAIHHGLEPTLDGGSVRVHACLHAGRLEVHVDDDGMGLDTPRRALRPGSGMALANLRARLQTRYGDAASLTLAGLASGTRATLALPCAKQDRCAP